MKIVIDCQPLVHNCMHKPAIRFIVDCYQKLSAENPAIDWCFLMDNTNSSSELVKQLPAHTIIFKKIFLNKLGWKWWYHYQLPAMIKKNPPDLLITSGGIIASTPVPQCVWLPGSVNQSDGNRHYYHFYKKNLVKTIHRPKMIFTLSEKIKKRIIRENQLDERKVIVVRAGTDSNFGPLTWAEKESIKTKFTAGKEYFLVIAENTRADLVEMLKAFSLFKKRQLSNMQMVFAGEAAGKDAHFMKKLESFKFRSDVHLVNTPNQPDFVKLIASAYALVYPSGEDETGRLVLLAFQAGVPAILSKESMLDEIAGTAALYGDISNYETMASLMISLFKDETMRNRLIENAKTRLAAFDKNPSFDELQQAVLKAAGCKNNSA